jgi:hypothetical protein
MAQTMYAHMNKWILKMVEIITLQFFFYDCVCSSCGTAVA